LPNFYACSVSVFLSLDAVGYQNSSRWLLCTDLRIRPFLINLLMKFLLVFSFIFKLPFDVIELLTFSQIGLDKGSHGRKIDFSEQVLACHFVFGLCVYFSVIIVKL